jgi:Electron transfer DM13
MSGFWRGLVIFLFGGMLGTGFGVALGFFLFPYVFPPPPANEQLTQADVAPLAGAAPPPATTPQSAPAAAPSAPAPAAPVPVATGTFIHANPSDPIHWGKGKVSAYDRTIFLEPDFEVGPGPKYHVYLVPKANVRREADVKNEMFVDLGRLRAFKGSQRYAIPDGVDVKKYASVVIWCERFGVLITPADLALAKR